MTLIEILCMWGLLNLYKSVATSQQPTFESDEPPLSCYTCKDVNPRKCATNLNISNRKFSKLCPAAVNQCMVAYFDVNPRQYSQNFTSSSYVIQECDAGESYVNVSEVFGIDTVPKSGDDLVLLNCTNYMGWKWAETGFSDKLTIVYHCCNKANCNGVYIEPELSTTTVHQRETTEQGSGNNDEGSVLLYENSGTTYRPSTRTSSGQRSDTDPTVARDSSGDNDIGSGQLTKPVANMTHAIPGKIPLATRNTISDDGSGSSDSGDSINLQNLPSTRAEGGDANSSESYEIHEITLPSASSQTFTDKPHSVQDSSTIDSQVYGSTASWLGINDVERFATFPLGILRKENSSVSSSNETEDRSWGTEMHITVSDNFSRPLSSGSGSGETHSTATIQTNDIQVHTLTNASSTVTSTIFTPAKSTTKTTNIDLSIVTELGSGHSGNIPLPPVTGFTSIHTVTTTANSAVNATKTNDVSMQIVNETGSGQLDSTTWHAVTDYLSTGVSTSPASRDVTDTLDEIYSGSGQSGGIPRKIVADSTQLFTTTYPTPFLTQTTVSEKDITESVNDQLTTATWQDGSTSNIDYFVSSGFTENPIVNEERQLQTTSNTLSPSFRPSIEITTVFAPFTKAVTKGNVDRQSGDFLIDEITDVSPHHTSQTVDFTVHSNALADRTETTRAVKQQKATTWHPITGSHVDTTFPSLQSTTSWLISSNSGSGQSELTTLNDASTDPTDATFQWKNVTTMHESTEWIEGSVGSGSKWTNTAPNLDTTQSSATYDFLTWFKTTDRGMTTVYQTSPPTSEENGLTNSVTTEDTFATSTTSSSISTIYTTFPESLSIQTLFVTKKIEKHVTPAYTQGITVFPTTGLADQKTTSNINKRTIVTQTTSTTLSYSEDTNIETHTSTNIPKRRQSTFGSSRVINTPNVFTYTRAVTEPDPSTSATSSSQTIISVVDPTKKMTKSPKSTTPFTKQTTETAFLSSVVTSRPTEKSTESSSEAQSTPEFTATTEPSYTSKDLNHTTPGSTTSMLSTLLSTPKPTTIPVTTTHSHRKETTKTANDAAENSKNTNENFYSITKPVPGTLVSVLLMINITVNINSERLVASLERRLEDVCEVVFGMIDKKNVSVKKRRSLRRLLQSNKYKVDVNSLERESDWAVDAKFSVTRNNEPIASDVVVQNLRKLSARQISSVVGYPVLSHATKVGVLPSGKTYYFTELVITIAVMSAIIIGLSTTFVFCFKYPKSLSRKNNRVSNVEAMLENGSLSPSTEDSTNAFCGTENTASNACLKDFPISYEKPQQAPKHYETLKPPAAIMSTATEALQTFEDLKQLKLQPQTICASAGTQTNVSTEREIEAKPKSPKRKRDENLWNPTKSRTEKSQTNHLSFLPLLPEKNIPLILQPLPQAPSINDHEIPSGVHNNPELEKSIRRSMTAERRRNKRRLREMAKKGKIKEQTPERSVEPEPPKLEDPTSREFYSACLSPPITLQSLASSVTPQESSSPRHPAGSSPKESRSRREKGRKRNKKKQGHKDQLQESLREAQHKLDELIGVREPQVFSPAYLDYQKAKRLRWKSKIQPGDHDVVSVQSDTMQMPHPESHRIFLDEAGISDAVAIPVNCQTDAQLIRVSSTNPDQPISLHVPFT